MHHLLLILAQANLHWIVSKRPLNRNSMRRNDGLYYPGWCAGMKSRKKKHHLHFNISTYGAKWQNDKMTKPQFCHFVVLSFWLFNKFHLLSRICKPDCLMKELWSGLSKMPDRIRNIQNVCKSTISEMNDLVNSFNVIIYKILIIQT